MAVKKRKDVVSKSADSEHCEAKTKGTNDAATSDKPVISFRRIAIRFMLLIGTMVILNIYSRWNTESEELFVGCHDEVDNKVQKVTCSNDYDKEKSKFSGCVPQWCGRVVKDLLVTPQEVNSLLRMAKAGLSLGGSNGGASILDIHSGALSKGDKFINIFKVMEETQDMVFSEDDFKVYRRVKDKIHSAIAAEFGVNKKVLHLTSPTFFSQMTKKAAKTIHDEYWHIHVDKETYGSFHYTSLLYLTTYNKDFTGGRFIFVDQGKNTTIEPRSGRVSIFTSGSENPHFVEKVQSGTRYAITVSFTCDPSKLIADPKLKITRS